MYKKEMVDVVNECADILEFLSYSFSTTPTSKQPTPMGGKAESGLCLILGNLSERLTDTTKDYDAKPTGLSIVSKGGTL